MEHIERFESLEHLNHLDLTTLDKVNSIIVGYSGTLTRSDHVRCTLERIWQCKLRNVFIREGSDTVDGQGIHDLLGGDIYFQNSKGTWCKLWFSEWGGIDYGSEE